MEFPRTLGQFFKRPLMFIRRADIDAASAFLMGFDLARDGEVLAGFREWLVMKLGYGNNFAWPELAIRLGYPEPLVRPLVLPAEDRERLMGLLFETIEEFWKEREAARGPGEILRRHSDWLRSQDWYQEVEAGRVH